MSNRVAGQALKIAAFAGLLLGSASLAGCATLGSTGFGGDVTGSTADAPAYVGQQAMPAALKPIGQQVAEGPYTPPEDISGGSGGLVTGSLSSGTITSSNLPPLTGNSPMSAQPSYAPSAAPKVASLGALPVNSSIPQPASVAVDQGPAYYHVIESGESLYTIARHYDVTAQAIMQANGLSAPDKIHVGQRIVIPGRADLLAAKDGQVKNLASSAPIPFTKDPANSVATTTTKVASLGTPAAPLKAPGVTAMSPAPAQTQIATADPAPAKIPPVEPAMSGADKFRWPVSGKVITDFIASKGTGINIDAPAGTAVRAAENGTIIYVGSGVEGYGNLILIRHPNGYVSAYAHLATTTVNKGDVVSRGDTIGTVGMTGSVTRPQLHFELRQGATPVDPIPMLAG